MIVPDLIKAVEAGQKKARVEIQEKCFMNERLQELYRVASEQFKIVQDQGLPAPYQTRAFAEKFAELIVRECANVLRAESERLYKLSAEEKDELFASNFEICAEIMK
jgi:hypothetical protein